MKYFFPVFFLLVNIVYPSEPCELVRVIDGDTVVVSINETETKIRLYEIDAPEMKQEYGPESKAELEKILKGKLSVDLKGRDVYGRELGTIYTDGKDAGLAMVKAGAAWPYKSKAPDQFYRYAMYAMWNHKGLWNGSHPLPPWEWRKESKGGHR